MCGIAIKYKEGFCQADRISHRGILKKAIKFMDFEMTHFKLPFQTNLHDEFSQPILLKNGNYLLFNGEIFNIPRGYENDVEYLIHFFSQNHWREAIGGEEYNEWDGFWAICIVTPEDEVIAFTDPLGKKQLYHKNGCISSEIKPLLDSEAKEGRFDFTKIEQTRLTPFEGVYRLEPNSLYSFKKGIARVLRQEIFNLHKTPWKFDFLGLMEESVKGRLVNRLDSNTLWVSGGLDSTIILYHIHKLGLLDTFQLLSVDNSEDSKYIEEIEDYFNCQVQKVKSIEISKGLKSDILKGYEYPMDRGSLFQQFRLCCESRGSVLYSGDGADELFSGYSRAKIVDTQLFDVFTELPYYHNLRLDRMGMVVTKEIRSPFMGHEIVRYALNLSYEERKGKKFLREMYGGLIPESIINRTKIPLRESEMFIDRQKYINSVIEDFYALKFTK